MTGLSDKGADVGNIEMVVAGSLTAVFVCVYLLNVNTGNCYN